MKLLFITPTIDERDDDLAFTSLWAQTFADCGYDVTVICGRKGATSLSFPVHGLGHDNKGGNKFLPMMLLLWLIVTLKYDRVFVHMNTGYLAVGAWYWWLRELLFSWGYFLCIFASPAIDCSGWFWSPRWRWWGSRIRGLPFSFSNRRRSG